MMKLSTKGRYGARLMLELAEHYGGSPVLLKEIARNQEISVGYLEHIISPLKAAGLINSNRGSHGGYMLAKAPSKIRLGEIVRVLEGPLSPVECVNSPSVCRRVKQCVTRDIWKKVGENISRTLDDMTLAKMLKMQKKKRID